MHTGLKVLLIGCAFIAFLAIVAILKISKQNELHDRKMEAALEKRFKKTEHTCACMKPWQYQVEIDDDSMYIFDGARKVGSMNWARIPAIDTIFLIDNE